MLARLNKFPQYIVVSLFLFAFLYASKTYAVPLQISPQQLSQQLNQVQQIILDIRPKDDYEISHIPTAINIPLSLFNKKKDGINNYVLKPIQFKKLMSINGIKNQDNIIIYGNWSFLGMARVFWIFELYGHKNIQILKGGFQNWEDQKLPLTNDIQAISLSNYIIQINPQHFATKFQTFMATKNEDYVIVDARPPKHFSGQTSLTDVKGRIPDSINIPWYEVINSREEKDGYNKINKVAFYKEIKRIKQIFSKIPKNKKIILYCNGTHESSVLYFALKKTGRSAQIYDGSWYEWSADDKMPIENPTLK